MNHLTFTSKDFNSRILIDEVNKCFFFIRDPQRHEKSSLTSYNSLCIIKKIIKHHLKFPGKDFDSRILIVLIDEVETFYITFTREILIQEF